MKQPMNVSAPLHRAGRIPDHRDPLRDDNHDHLRTLRRGHAGRDHRGSRRPARQQQSHRFLDIAPFALAHPGAALELYRPSARSLARTRPDQAKSVMVEITTPPGIGTGVSQVVATGALVASTASLAGVG